MPLIAMIVDTKRVNIRILMSNNGRLSGHSLSNMSGLYSATTTNNLFEVMFRNIVIPVIHTIYCISTNTASVNPQRYKF